MNNWKFCFGFEVVFKNLFARSQFKPNWLINYRNLRFRLLPFSSIRSQSLLDRLIAIPYRLWLFLLVSTTVVSILPNWEVPGLTNKKLLSILFILKNYFLQQIYFSHFFSKLVRFFHQHRQFFRISVDVFYYWSWVRSGRYGGCWNHSIIQCCHTVYCFDEKELFSL